MTMPEAPKVEAPKAPGPLVPNSAGVFEVPTAKIIVVKPEPVINRLMASATVGEPESPQAAICASSIVAA